MTRYIGYATSRDGINFERMSDDPVLWPENPYENTSCMNPYVLWDEKRQLWQMWYSAGETYEPNVIAYAESVDGLNWTKRRANPILIKSQHNVWEQERVGGCHVLKHGAWYYIFYIGYEDIDTARICVARSPDGITRWERHPANPLVSPTPDSWDHDACYKPFVVYEPEKERWLMWYNGRHAAPEYIGLVIHDGADLWA